MGKVIEMPERVDLTLSPGMVAEIKRHCFHQRGRIARFVTEALREKLDRDGQPDDAPRAPDGRA